MKFEEFMKSFNEDCHLSRSECELVRLVWQELQPQWQPIETAPIDGTVVDLWVNGERNPACAWKNNKGWCFRLYYTDGTGYGWHKIKGSPTHWMPIHLLLEDNNENNATT